MSDYYWPDDENVSVELTVEQWAIIAYHIADDEPDLLDEIDGAVTGEGYNTVWNNV